MCHDPSPKVSAETAVQDEFNRSDNILCECDRGVCGVDKDYEDRRYNREDVGGEASILEGGGGGGGSRVESGGAGGDGGGDGRNTGRGRDIIRSISLQSFRGSAVFHR